MLRPRLHSLAFLLAPLVAAACTAGGGDGGGDDDNVADECANPAPLAAGVSTLAGCGQAGADDGDRATARFSNPVNVVRGPDNKLYVADFDNGRIRVVDDAGRVSTLVQQEGFERPFGLAFVGNVLYVSTDNDDSGDHSDMTGTVWRVDTNSGAATVVVRDVGRPRGLLALSDGRLVLSDYQHHALRFLNPTTGALSNLAGAMDQDGMADGRGTTARFSMPYGAAQLPDGAIVVADYQNNRLRKVALDGTVTTYAGTGSAGSADGDAASASFNGPQGVAADDAGNVYVTDLENYTIRKITPDGTVSTIAGDGEGGWLDDADPRAAELYGLEGLAVSPDGSTIWAADGSRGEPLPYHRVRRITLD